MSIETIHESMINGQRKQAVRQMEEYGMYDFFEDYGDYLGGLYSPLACFEYLKDAASSYHRIKNR